MTSRSDSGVAGWGLTKTELRTACGQGKWDREVETWERELAFLTSPHMRTRQWHLQALEEVGTYVTPTQLSP